SGYCPSIAGRGGQMEKETFILQTTRAGRLPTNASFTDENVARAETERAQGSGAFEHIKLVSMMGADRRVLFEIGKASTSVRPSAGAPKPGAAARPKKQVSAAQLISRISTLITMLLIFGVIAYAVEYFMTK
ncbi:MAG: hypothetical protein QOJ54_1877, partial [Aliidongia sp.]|nr:hypothetical protein [Aliidongia sp.]